ncbi:AraC family transcriptional regulator [Maribacter algicola]|uniref:AraC family transcriptional regulator n=1 Tax=Meishania litoralis TaxID=3434685 RepID=A0ACC7LRN0_9FLAO
MEVHKPNRKELDHYITMMYVVGGGSNSRVRPYSEMSLPSGHPFIVFKHSGDFTIHNNILNKTIELPKMYFTGQQVSSANITSKDKFFEAFVICLRPTAVWHIFGIDVSTLEDEVMDLEIVIKNSQDLFGNLLRKDLKINQRIEIFENGLIEHLNDKKFESNIIDIAVDKILKAKGCVKIQDLASKLNISIRYFRKKFKEIVGVTPSVYTRIIRFNYLFSEMNSQNKNDFISLGAYYGYFDIAHFSRDFKKYCGHAPTKFHLDKFNFFKEVWIDDPLILKID